MIQLVEELRWIATGCHHDDAKNSDLSRNLPVARDKELRRRPIIKTAPLLKIHLNKSDNVMTLPTVTTVKCGNRCLRNPPRVGHMYTTQTVAQNPSRYSASELQNVVRCVKACTKHACRGGVVHHEIRRMKCFSPLCTPHSANSCVRDHARGTQQPSSRPTTPVTTVTCETTTGSNDFRPPTCQVQRAENMRRYREPYHLCSSARQRHPLSLALKGRAHAATTAVVRPAKPNWA